MAFWLIGKMTTYFPEGTLKIVANGNDDYTITGSFKAIDEDDKNTELEIEYTGKLPCEDYSY